MPQKLLLLSISCLLWSCINIPLKDVSSTPYKKIHFTPPSAKTYKLIESNKTDSIWINKLDGTIISSKSECDPNSQTLESYTTNIINDLQDSIILQEQDVVFNGRPGQRKIFTAKIDGIKTYFDVVAFKKHGCLFLLSRNGLKKGFSGSKDDFETFLKGFKVHKS